MHFYPTYWHRLFTHWQKDIKMFLGIVVLLGFCRISLLLFFYKNLGDSIDISSFLICFYRGFQYDARVASSLVLCTFVPAILTLRRWSIIFDKYLNDFRLIFSSLFFFLTLLLTIINIGFFAEYHDQFNHWIFGIIFDDQKAIFHTIWNSYPVVFLLFILLSLSLVSIYLLKKSLKTPFINTYLFHPSIFNRFTQCILIIICLSLLVGGIRGSFGRRPLQNIDIAITKSSFLNKIVLNPYFAIVYAIYDYQTLKSSAGIKNYWPSGNVKEALAVLNPNIESDCILDYISKQTKGNEHSIPDHIFLVVMESQSSWTLLDAYQELNLNPGLRSLAKEGIHIQAALSASSGTMTSLSAIITGCPYAGILPNYHSHSQTPYPTAIAPIFKKLGYQVNFFYGGYLSWQRIEEFCKNQGFDNVYGGHLMGPWEDNEWGVSDASLFNFVEKITNNNVRSLNIILTTSNHPPYSINLKKEGCPVTNIPEALAKKYDGTTSIHVLAHTWYGDKCVSSFVRKANHAFSNSLFVITGDHWSRRFLNKNPSLYESTSVPIIFYGPSILDEKLLSDKNLVASHIDIIPSLVHLCTPNKLSFYAFGRDIFNSNTDPIAFGAEAIITPDYIFLSNLNLLSIEPLPFSKEASIPDTQYFIKYYKAMQASSWWLLTQGVDL